jgi:hypothetical protein
MQSDNSILSNLDQGNFHFYESQQSTKSHQS